MQYDSTKVKILNFPDEVVKAKKTLDIAIEREKMFDRFAVMNEEIVKQLMEEIKNDK